VLAKPAPISKGGGDWGPWRGQHRVRARPSLAKPAQRHSRWKQMRGLTKEVTNQIDHLKNISIQIRTSDLKALTVDIEIGPYILYPHFFVKIFNVAEQCPRLKTFLMDRGFYSITRSERSKLVQSHSFFHCMQDNKCDTLYPRDYWDSL
jgi:hypothetical protein